jgi:hypothetical protein
MRFLAVVIMMGAPLCGQDFARNFIRAFESGTRLRLMQEETELIRLQREALQLEISRLQQQVALDRQRQTFAAAGFSEGQLEIVRNIVQRAIAEMETKTAFAAMDKMYPGWRKYEDRMAKIGAKWEKSPDATLNTLSSLEYAEQLYLKARTEEAIELIDRKNARPR